MQKTVAGVTAVPQLGCPHDAGEYYYYNYRDNTPQPLMYRQSKADNDPAQHVFMDANKFSDRGTTAVQICAFSNKASYFAYGLSEGGSDWLTIYVKPMRPDRAFATVPEPAFYDGIRLADKIEDVKWSAIHWSHHEDGFYYQRFPRRQTAGEPDRDSALYFHRLGTPQAEDILVHKDPESPFKQYFPPVSDDGAWLIITETHQGSLTDEVIILSTIDGAKSIARLESDNPTNPVFIGNVGTVFYFSTTWNASRGRVVSYNMETDTWRECIAEHGKAILRAAYAYSEQYLLIVYLCDVKDELWIFDLSSGRKMRQIGKDIIGSVQIKQTLGSRMSAELFLKVSSYTAPDLIYAIKEESLRLYNQTRTPAFDPGAYTTRQEFYNSKDGTPIPMFLTHKANERKCGPVLLYGYGGFNVSVIPNYNPAFMSFLRGFGGMVVCVNLRGGGEYGEEWHRAGMLDKKQNVMDDFHSAAAYLVEAGYTTADQIVAQGGSNGGLVVAACLNQRPELYGCVVAKVPVLDCLRYTSSAAGSLGIGEIGDPKEPVAFDYLRAYSPLHNVDAAKPYPPALFLTADHDNRVPPMHSLKHVATLQHQKRDDRGALMLRVDKQSGHGQGKALDKMIDELCDQWSFVALSTVLIWQEKEKKKNKT